MTSTKSAIEIDGSCNIESKSISLLFQEDLGNCMFEVDALFREL